MRQRWFRLLFNLKVTYPSWSIGGKSFIMRYVDVCCCVAQTSTITALVPAYSWNNHAVRYLMARYHQDGEFQFFVDGVVALHQSKISPCFGNNGISFDLGI